MAAHYPFALSLSKGGPFFYRGSEELPFDKLRANGGGMLLKLVPHPAHPPKAITAVEVRFPRTFGLLWFEFTVQSKSGLALPAGTAGGRADELWKTTCFELFVRPGGGEDYVEFNFSPSFQWAAYGFSGYREGMHDLAIADPEIYVSDEGQDYHLAVEGTLSMPKVASTLSFSAVIEESDGTKSFWALAHPPGKPDFHHPDCFVLELPAPELP